MRLHTTATVLLLLAVVACSAPAGSRSRFVLHRQVRGTDAAPVQDTLAALGVELLESSNFNTAAHAGLLKQDIPAIQERYRQVVAGDCLIVTYDRPVVVRTVGGAVPVVEIVIGLARSDRADALFTIDAEGRVVAHEKYSGRVALELRRAAASPAAGR